MFNSSDLIYPIITEQIYGSKLYLGIDFDITSTLIQIPKNSTRVDILDILAAAYYDRPETHHIFKLEDLLVKKYKDVTPTEIEFYKLKYS